MENGISLYLQNLAAIIEQAIKTLYKSESSATFNYVQLQQYIMMSYNYGRGLHMPLNKSFKLLYVIFLEHREK